MKTIPQRVLRNKSGEVLRRQLGPLPRREWVARPEYLQLIVTGGHDPEFSTTSLR